MPTYSPSFVKGFHSNKQLYKQIKLQSMPWLLKTFSGTCFIIQPYNTLEHLVIIGDRCYLIATGTIFYKIDPRWPPISVVTFMELQSEGSKIIDSNTEQSEGKKDEGATDDAIMLEILVEGRAIWGYMLLASKFKCLTSILSPNAVIGRFRKYSTMIG